jgi:hypothetical protein
LKSILFTHFKEKLLDRTKQQTTRLIVIPRYHVKEDVKLRFKYDDGSEEDLFVVRISTVFPIQMKAATEEIAVLDGFKSIPEYWEALMEINHRKKVNDFLEDWGFITRWEDIDQTPYLPNFGNTLDNYVAKPEFHENFKTQTQSGLDEIK